MLWRDFVKKRIVLIGKEIYLFFVWLSYKISRKKTRKIVVLLSFPQATEHLLAKLYENFKNQLVICYTKDGSLLAKQYQSKGCEVYDLDNFYTILRKIVPVLKGADIVFCDNYFAFLAGMTFDDRTKVVQLWHADGAIKKFGLEAEYTRKVDSKDRKRYLDVYSKFTHYVVSSKKMSDVFSDNYKTEFKELKFGYLPTDLYFNSEWMDQSRKKFQEVFHTDKKILVYTPTYRESKETIPLDFSKLKDRIGEEWEIFVKAHPHDKELQQQLSEESGIITNFKGLTLQQLLPSVDCLITDYSSVPFEYTLANDQGKIIFFCYDLERYRQEVGIESDFEQWMPGSLVKTESELFEEIDKHSKSDFQEFNQVWNTYANGTAADQLIEWVNQNYEN